jgi:sterol desaturase/sphingolipid hydroxylase (fatty acid hydroxylase superfamily)
MSPTLILLAVPFFIATFWGEAHLRRRRGMPFDVEDGATSVAMGTVFLVINLIGSGLTMTRAEVLYEHRLWSLEDGAWVWALALVADDFVFYWAHRISHEVRFFWATHEAHHSSEQYTLTTALRQPWTEPIAVLFWLPLPLLGLPLEMLVVTHTANLLYQYWIHTELIGRLGILEWILNTPSHHRVHHGTNPRYLDKNYGGIFIVWDRLFGTFEPETEPPRYGLTNPLTKRGAVHASFHEWLAIARDLRRARTWRGRMMAVFGRTGTEYLACERTPAAH